MDIDNQHFISSMALKNHHDIIVQDIQGDVFLALLQKEVLTQNEYDTIKSMKNREKEVCYLLDMLTSKGNHGIQKFLNYLSTYYCWISEHIERSMLYEYTNAINTYASLTKIENVLNIGEVPQLSSRHVSRAEHVKTLKVLLKNLEPGNFVVVNGMTGCGKSSLVIEVLNDILITMHYFQGFVQWINVGRENSSDVGCIQTEILNRLNNQEQLISPPLSTNYEATRKTLRNLLKQKQMTNGLLVLDDVYSNEIVKFLDIGCKILITTHDKSIMEEIVDTRVKYLKVNEGFEETETLDLFSKCLSINYESLPSHALKLHKICKGFPLTISLIGAQLKTHKEETINNIDRWKFYLEELESSDKMSEPFKYTKNSYKRFKSLEKAIEMCIKSLPDDLQRYYQDFSLFVPDLNIKPEVLSVLWDLKKIQAEDIMLELIHKSLLVRVWNQPLKSYVYSIHDLLLSNLKKMKNDQESKLLHKKLIERYRTKCNGNFAKLPKNDNYIFLYFGYHLKCADMLEEFSRWFLNLKFIESKIHVTGPADLLSDLRKYRKYIAVKSIYEEHIKEIEHFVVSVGPNLYQTKSDIVQLGLQEPETSFLYKESYTIAQISRKSYFYYNIRPFKNCLPEPFTSIVRDQIETVIFGNRHDEVIIATKCGIIKIWNIMSHKCVYTYNGHTDKVTYLVKNKFKTRFLSTSHDSTIRIWNLKNFSEFDDSETRTPSPETRQDYYQNLFDQKCDRPNDTTDCIYILRGHSKPVIFAQFSSDDRLVVSSSIDKTLKIWKLEDSYCTLFQTINQNSIIYKCYFMENASNDCFIVFSTQTQTGSGIYYCKWPFMHCNGLLYLKEKLISFSPLPSIEENGNLIIITSNKLGYYKLNWGDPIYLVEYDHYKGYQNIKLPTISDEYISKINNSRFLAVLSLNNFTIKICDLFTAYNFLDLNHSVQTVLNIDWFWSNTDQSNWLLCAAEDKSIRLWRINNISQYTCAHKINSASDLSETESTTSRFENICKNEIMSLQKYKLISGEQILYCYFDAIWLDNNSNVLIAAITKCGALKILSEDLDKWSMIDKRVSALSIVHSEQKYDQTMIIVTCEDLSVHMLKFHMSKHLFDTSDVVEQIFTCFDHGTLIIACLLKKHEEFKQMMQIKINNTEINVDVRNFIDCYVFYDKVIVLHNIHEVMIINVRDETKALLEISCIKVNGTLMLDHSTLAVTDNANHLCIFKITTDIKLKLLNDYKLPFKDNELTFLNLSNNKDLISVSGQNNVVLIDRKTKMIMKNFTIDPWVNNIHIQSVMWSSDDTCLAIKEDNHIIVFDVKLGKKIASVRLTAKKFSVDSNLKTFIALNTTGQLVMLKLK